MRILRCLLSVFALLPLLGLAQERAQPIRRNESWVSAAVQGRLPEFLRKPVGDNIYKRIRLSGEVGYRSADVFFAGQRTYIELGARYKLNDHLSVTGQHQISFRSGRLPANQSKIMGTWRTEWNRFNFAYRFTYQHNAVDFGEEREVIRNRFEVGYDIRKFKLDPHVSTEFFTWIGHQGMQYIATRHIIGTEYAPNKTHTFGLDLMHDREYGTSWPVYRWIVSLSYTLNLREL